MNLEKNHFKLILKFLIQILDSLMQLLNCLSSLINLFMNFHLFLLPIFLIVLHNRLHIFTISFTTFDRLPIFFEFSIIFNPSIIALVAKLHEILLLKHQIPLQFLFYFLTLELHSCLSHVKSILNWLLDGGNNFLQNFNLGRMIRNLLHNPIKHRHKAVWVDRNLKETVIDYLIIFHFYILTKRKA